MRCEKMHATISVRQCLINQEGKGSFYAGTPSGRYPGCRNCEDGRLARAGQLSDSDLEKLRNEVIGMKIETDADPKSTPSSAEENGALGGEAGERICRQCKKGKPLDKDHYYESKRSKGGFEGTCIECRRLNINERRGGKTKRSRSKVARKGKQAVEPGDSIGSSSGAQLLVTVDLTDFPELHENLHREAGREDRTPELQLRWILRSHVGQGGRDEDQLETGGDAPDGQAKGRFIR